MRSLVARLRAEAVTNQRTHEARTAQAITEPTLTVHDATGDEVGFHRTAIDLTAAGVHGGTTRVTFASRVVAPVDPSTNPSWLNGNSTMLWGVDGNFDDNAEKIALLVNDGSGGLIAAFESFEGGDECLGTGEWLANHDYAVSFPRGCFKGVPQFQWIAASFYFPDLDHFGGDNAPSNSYAPPVRRTEGEALAGYWMLGADGTVYPFGASFAFDTQVDLPVSIGPRRDGTGYWVVDLLGGVHKFGRTKVYGQHPALRAGEIVTSISSTKTGRGYWLFTSMGRVFPFGDAKFFGDLRNKTLNGPVIASAVTASGKGYFMVGSDGGLFTFGNARFRGSMGGKPLNAPIVGIATDPDGDGYWLVGSDGGVFGFHAAFRGSMVGKHLNGPVNGMVAFGNGYLMVARDGGVFNFSNKKFLGSRGGRTLPAPIIDIAAFTS